MSRKNRELNEIGCYHIIIRGNNKQTLFYDNSDFNFFIKRMNKYTNELNIELYGYCLMQNHVHLLIGKANPNLSKLVLKLCTSYAMYFNHKYERTGHLFQGRFKSECINDESYFKTVLRYILKNPEKANICKYCDYKWSNFKQILAQKSLLYKQLIITNFCTINSFLDFLETNNNDKCMEYENKIFLTDLKCFRLIKKLLKIEEPHQLVSYNLKDLQPKIRILRNHGISVSQLSRITGLSKKIILSA
ncbi:MAG: transposase [Treponema sp.]|nr:transposase [Treponema sp.]